LYLNISNFEYKSTIFCQFFCQNNFKNIGPIYKKIRSLCSRSREYYEYLFMLRIVTLHLSSYVCKSVIRKDSGADPATSEFTTTTLACAFFQSSEIYLFSERIRLFVAL
jgi:hypothetical protein